MKVYLFIILLFLILSGCGLSESKIKAYSWKYAEGYYIGDFIVFDSTCSIKNDTIFINDLPIVHISKAYKKIDGSGYMEIESFDSFEKGWYDAK